ncbi:MAG: nitrite/sulfite reductase, partial [Pseudomonadota bacterium]
HHVGHIGILGLEKGGVESYQITLGGDATESAALGERTGPGFGADEVPEAIGRLVDHYKSIRQDDETFLQTCRRVGVREFKEALYAA